VRKPSKLENCLYLFINPEFPSSTWPLSSKHRIQKLFARRKKSSSAQKDWFQSKMKLLTDIDRIWFFISTFEGPCQTSQYHDPMTAGEIKLGDLFTINLKTIFSSFSKLSILLCWISSLGRLIVLSHSTRVRLNRVQFYSWFAERKVLVWFFWRGSGFPVAMILSPTHFCAT
jgi:hypothetical protein